MKLTAFANPFLLNDSVRSKYSFILVAFTAGLLGPLGFAPFHMPGLVLLSNALFYATVNSQKEKQSFILGFFYGLAYFGFGISWIIISIHDYGNLNYFISAIVTLIFIAYLSLYPALVALCYGRLAIAQKPIINLFLFACLGVLAEFLRSSLFTGFPWLLIGTSQIDSPLKYLFPICGIYGVGFISLILSALLSLIVYDRSLRRYIYTASFALIFLIPNFLKESQWTTVSSDTVSVGGIQANLAMRNKWDESLFWNLLQYYEKNIEKLLGNKLIILPEAAIPLPANYLQDYLDKLDKITSAAKSSLFLGILQESNENENYFYNALISLGKAKGEHVKHHLVPFGEYIPPFFGPINRWLNLESPNIIPGKDKQDLITMDNYSIASLICYEIAFPNLLRKQLPEAQWIVSISDNGWFGHSLASYQQLQMGQVLSLLTGRYHILLNNVGLSSIINAQGDIVNGLPPFTAGLLQGEVHPANGRTPWVIWSDYPSLIFCLFVLLLVVFLRFKPIPSH